MVTQTKKRTAANGSAVHEAASSLAQGHREFRRPDQPRAPSRISDAEELRHFIGQNARSMLQKAMVFCHDDIEEARELLQELFPRMVIVLEHSRCGIIEHPWACAHQIMARLAIDHFRKERRTRARIKRLEFPDSIPDEPPATPDGEEVARALQALDALPPRDRHILVSVFLEGCKAKDVAQRLNLSEARLSELKTLALGRLREVLK